jgi:hypothetical protein
MRYWKDGFNDFRILERVLDYRKLCQTACDESFASVVVERFERLSAITGRSLILLKRSAVQNVELLSGGATSNAFTVNPIRL